MVNIVYYVCDNNITDRSLTTKERRLIVAKYGSWEVDSIYQFIFCTEN
jgi:hypothetical protein